MPEKDDLRILAPGRRSLSPSCGGTRRFDGDLLVVVRNLEAAPGDIVVAVLNGEFTIKRLRRTGASIELVPENPKYRKITLSEGMDLEIAEVVLFRKIR